MYFKPSSLTDISISLQNNTQQLDKYIAETYKQISEVEKKLHSLLPERTRKKRLLTQAKELAEKYPNTSSRPTLYGALVGIDDMFRVDGLPTTAGSEVPREVFAGKEATAVTLLKEAGALVIGKTVCTEFGYLKSGPTINPHDPDFSPGGASSGAATAVSAGLCPLAIGIQTTASIIRSASYCGVVGFKPSMGRIPEDGIVPFAQSLEQPGFFTQDVSGAILAAGVLLTEWDTSVNINSKPKICLPSDAFLVQAHYDVYNRFYKKIDVLTSSGYEVINFPLFKEIKDINKIHRELAAGEFARNHKKWFSEYGEFYSKSSRDLYDKGSKIKKATLEADKVYQVTLRESIREIMQSRGIDLWICPSSVTSAPRGLESTGSPLMSLPWTFAGLPSISIPAGKSSHNLPIGIQLIAGYNCDEQLLQYAGELFRLLSY